MTHTETGSILTHATEVYILFAGSSQYDVAYRGTFLRKQDADFRGKKDWGWWYVVKMVDGVPA